MTSKKVLRTINFECLEHFLSFLRPTDGLFCEIPFHANRNSLVLNRYRAALFGRSCLAVSKIKYFLPHKAFLGLNLFSINRTIHNLLKL